MKKIFPVVLMILLLTAESGYCALDTISNFVMSEATGNNVSSISLWAINTNNNQLIVKNYTSPICLLIVTSGYNITIRPDTIYSSGIQGKEYDFYPKEYNYPAINSNKTNTFTLYDQYFPMAPTIVSPKNGTITTVNPTITWNKLNSPKYYFIIISTSATLKDTVYKKDSIPKTDTSFTLPTNLKGNTVYYFQIQSITYPYVKVATPSAIGNFKTNNITGIIQTRNIRATKLNLAGTKYYNLQGKLISSNSYNILYGVIISSKGVHIKGAF